MHQLISQAADIALSEEGLSRNQALELMAIEKQEDLIYLTAAANSVRQRFHGNKIELCSIINARSGRCSEDCTFCAQSSHNEAEVDVYPLMDRTRILDAAQQARDIGISRFSIVTSGKGAKADKELDQIAETIDGIKKLGLSPCASLGILTPEAADVLRNAGLVSYHHNLETAPEYYDKICTTHSIEDRMDTARKAKDEGFRLCCGGIVGMGETREMRVNLAYALRDLNVDSVPLNFLNPIPGTPLEDAPPLPPMETLKIISVFRLVLPKADIRICGGREKNLRSLQALIYQAGANAVMTGNYLTTLGRSPEEDVREIIDLGLEIK